MTGSLISKVSPVYPPEAKAAHVEGNVILDITVSPEGSVSVIRPITWHPALVEAAMNAVAQWKYRPYELNGEPVAVETTVKVEFHL